MNSFLGIVQFGDLVFHGTDFICRISEERGSFGRRLVHLVTSSFLRRDSYEYTNTKMLNHPEEIAADGII